MNRVQLTTRSEAPTKDGNKPSRSLRLNYHREGSYYIDTIITNLPVPYDLCVGTLAFCLRLRSVLNVLVSPSRRLYL